MSKAVNFAVDARSCKNNSERMIRRFLKKTKKTRISINKMKNLIKKIGYSISKESNWFIRPAYSFRFGLPKIINPFSWIPILNEIFCNGMLFLLKKEEA